MERRHPISMSFDIATLMLKTAKCVHNSSELHAFRAINRASSCVHMEYGYSLEMRNFLTRKAIACYNTNCRDTLTSCYTGHKVIYGQTQGAFLPGSIPGYPLKARQGYKIRKEKSNAYSQHVRYCSRFPGAQELWRNGFLDYLMDFLVSQLTRGIKAESVQAALSGCNSRPGFQSPGLGLDYKYNPTPVLGTLVLDFRGKLWYN